MPMSATTDVPNTVDEGLLAAELAALRAAEQNLEEAQLAASAAKDQLAVTLFDAARAYRSREEPMPRELVRALYWDRPELRVRDITSAFGLRMRELTDLVGYLTEHAICSSCNRDTEVRRRSRSHRPSPVCPACREADEQRERLAREREAHRLELEAQRRRAMWAAQDGDPMYRPYGPDGAPPDVWPWLAERGSW